MKVFSTLMYWSNENKSCTRVDKREFRVFSTLSQPNENKSCMRIEESLHWSEFENSSLLRRHESVKVCVYF